MTGDARAEPPPQPTSSPADPGPTPPSTASPEETQPTQPPPRKKGRRGFASMDKEKQKAIAASGGRAAHARGTAHEFTPEEARLAGRVGGAVAQQRRAERRGGTEGT